MKDHWSDSLLTTDSASNDSTQHIRTGSRTATGYVTVCLWLLLCLVASVPLARAEMAGTSTPDPTAGSSYVGSETCQGCHSDLYEKNFAGTPHAALLKMGKHGCESCHGPGSAHVDGGGDVSKIVRYAKLSPVEASRRCMRCHQSGLENQHFGQSVHLSEGVGCLDCHSPHHGLRATPLLVKRQPQLCFSCHAQQKAEFSRPYRHRVKEGLIECSDCHNPHGSTSQHQLRTASGGMQVCTKCHTEKQGPYVFEHLAVKQDGCMGCHTPHGSTNPRLLRVSQINLLCLQCHSATSRTADADLGPPEIRSFHRQTAQYQACTMCHTQIHGSNFSDVFFR